MKRRETCRYRELVERGAVSRSRSATKNVGVFLGDTLRGRVVVGAPADLIVVDANPLDELATLRKPFGVMTNGRWYDRAQLDSMLAASRPR